MVKDREELIWLEERWELPLTKVLEEELEVFRDEEGGDDAVGGRGRATTRGGVEATGGGDLGSGLIS